MSFYPRRKGIMRVRIGEHHPPPPLEAQSNQLGPPEPEVPIVHLLPGVAKMSERTQSPMLSSKEEIGASARRKRRRRQSSGSSFSSSGWSTPSPPSAKRHSIPLYTLTSSSEGSCDETESVASKELILPNPNSNPIPGPSSLPASGAQENGHHEVETPAELPGLGCEPLPANSDSSSSLGSTLEITIPRDGQVGTCSAESNHVEAADSPATAVPHLDEDEVPTAPTSPVSPARPTVLHCPFPPISFTEDDRMRRKYVDLLITTRPPEVPPGEGVQGDDIFGHRIVLEQIPFFKPQLGHTLGEIDIIQVPGLNAVALEAVIRMYYTQELAFPYDCSLADIFAVIDKFEIRSRNLTCWAVRALAVAKNDQRLLDACDSYILNNFATAIEDEAFLEIQYRQLYWYVTRGVKLGSSPRILILTAIVKWGSYSTESRRELVFNLVTITNLSLIFRESSVSREKLRQLFTGDSILATIPSCVDLHNRVLFEEAYGLANDSGTRDRIEPENESTSTQAPPDPRAIKTETVENGTSGHAALEEFQPPPPPPLDFHDSTINNSEVENFHYVNSNQGEGGNSQSLTPRWEELPGFSEAAEQVLLLLSPDLLDRNPGPIPVPQPKPPGNQVLLYTSVPDETGTCYLAAFDFSDNKAYSQLHKMTRPRQFSCLVQIDNAIYDIGGVCRTSKVAHATIWDQMESSNNVDIFTKGKLLPKKGYCIKKKRRVFSANVVGRNIIIIGGDTNDSYSATVVSNVVEKMDRSLAVSKTKGLYSWNVESYLKMPRSCHASALLANRLYVAGGVGIWDPECAANTSALKSVEVLNTAASDHLWEDAKDMLVGRRCFRLHVTGRKMYAIGGEDNNGYVLNSTEVYDPETNDWTLLANMHHGRSEFGVLEVNGHIYVVGGNEENSELNIEAYDPDKNSWTLVPWPEELDKRTRFISSTHMSRDYLLSSS